MAQPSLQQLLHQALAHHRAGRLPDAITGYEQALDAHADSADALHLLGLAKHQAGRSDEGIPLIQRAITLHPTASEFHANLAGVFAARGRLAEAISCMRRAMQLRPGDETLRRRLGQYLQQLGGALLDQDRPADAVPALEESLRLRPDAPDALANLGLAHARAKRYEKAVALYEEALALKDDIPELHTNLGAALLSLGRPRDAADAHRRALELRPDWPAAKTNLAIALAQIERYDEALALHEDVLCEQPDDPNALFNRGVIRLARGDFAGGWRDYEARVRVPELKGQSSFPQPRWTRDDPAGRTILVHAEQGLGDTIQFVRYVPLLLARGARVVVQCDPLLTRLMRHSFPEVTVVARRDPLPPFDSQIPIMSLPHAFGTAVETIPTAVPYLHVAPELEGAWRTKLARTDDTFRVGLVWSGNADHYNDRNRSISLAALLPVLARVPNVRLFSLQNGPRTEQLKRAELRTNVTDLAPDLADLADTAAAIAQLDLVLSVDTSIAHLAGALGAAVWTLLPRPADFRWMLDREDSPWYPTMRLFRQSRAAAWDDVFERVASQLAEVAASQRRLHGLETRDTSRT